MKISHLLWLSAIIAAVPVSAATPYINISFSNGMPKDILTSHTGSKVAPTGYKQTFSEDWFVGSVGTTGNAAVCATYTNSQEPSERTMTLPAFKVENENAILRWKARKMLPDRNESYRVDVRDTESNETITIIDTLADSHTWKYNAVSLERFNGRNIEVSFVCTTPNGYMMALNDIFAGVPETLCVNTIITSPVFQAQNLDGLVSGSIANFGITPENAELVLMSEGNEVERVTVFKKLDLGETYEFSIPFTNLTPNTKTNYTILLDASNAEPIEVASGFVQISDYRRRNIVDKATGMWCNNCPEGTITIHQQQEIYGDQLIIIEDHGGDDVLTVPSYWSKLNLFSAPCYEINRNGDQGQTSGTWSRVEDLLFAPAIARFNISNASIDNTTKSINLKFEAEFAEDVDNSSNRYRVAWAFTHLVHNPSAAGPYYQKNSCTNTKWEEYYWLPNRIDCQLTYMHNVNVTDESAFIGVEGSIPATISAKTPFTGQLEIPIDPSFIEEDPELLGNFEQRLVIYILDTESGSIKCNPIINADEIYLKNMPFEGQVTAVDTIISDSNFNADRTPVYFNLNGVRIANPTNGLFIEKRGSEVKKVFIK